jgi:hypothetical protein
MTQPQRPLFREIMENIALDTLDAPALCFAMAWLMFVGLIGYSAYRLVVY